MLHAHLIFVAKYRRRVFDALAIDAHRDIFADVCSHAQATLVEMDGEDGHVHLLVEYPPKVAVSSLVNSLKTSRITDAVVVVGNLRPVTTLS